MGKLSLWSLIIVVSSIVSVKASDIYEASSRDICTQTEAESSNPIEQQLITSDEKLNVIRHFRISGHSTEYYDDVLNESRPKYFSDIVARKGLYDLIYELAVPIERYDTTAFESVVDARKEDIGFCLRFHLIALVLHLFENTSTFEGVDRNCFSRFVELIKGIESSRDVSNEIVKEQLRSLTIKVHEFIDNLYLSSFSNFGQIYVSEFAEGLRDYLVLEADKIHR